jgi:Ca2+-binding RTX toxin-like protein
MFGRVRKALSLALLFVLTGVGSAAGGSSPASIGVWSPAWSPDGALVAWTQRRGGQRRPFPGPDEARLPHDDLHGGSGNDLLNGGPGSDFIAAGPGIDVVRARDGARDLVYCGGGYDVVLADAFDRVDASCERVVGS